MKQLVLLLTLTLSSLSAFAQHFILGAELSNSAATSIADIDSVIPKVARAGINTVLVPAQWDLIEPREGVFDFSTRRNNPRSPTRETESYSPVVRCVEELHELLCTPLVQARQAISTRHDSRR